ncbi:MAG: DUF6636 domain-containing protein [Thermoleophilia bacterium]
MTTNNSNSNPLSQDQPRTGRRLASLVATASVVVAVLAFAGQGSAASTSSFRSPSGNIHCFLTSDTTVQCWVLSATCRGYGGATYAWSWAMDNTRRPSRFCPGDLVRGTRVLPYGRSITKGGNKCVSRKSGVTCTRLTTGRGFFLSRERQRIF